LGVTLQRGPSVTHEVTDDDGLVLWHSSAELVEGQHQSRILSDSNPGTLDDQTSEEWIATLGDAHGDVCRVDHNAINTERCKLIVDPEAAVTCFVGAVRGGTRDSRHFVLPIHNYSRYTFSQKQLLFKRWSLLEDLLEVLHKTSNVLR
jgi:hypothetical protein